MSLLDLINSGASASPAQGQAEKHSRYLRRLLRAQLLERIPASELALLVDAGPEQATQEVIAVLEQLIAGPDYLDLERSQKEDLVEAVRAVVLGLGPLEPLLSDPEVSEIMVNGPQRVFYERSGRLFQSNSHFFDEQQLYMVIDRIVAPLGRRIDEQSPLVSARLASGHRVHAVIPPIALDGPLLTIRKFPEQVYTLKELQGLGTLDEPTRRFLEWAVIARRNIAVSGGTGSGKTTFLNALSLSIDPGERIVTIEDAAELKFSAHPHVVRLEARAAGSEGSGQVSIRDLVINALRMRPDRIVVGECRGAEALDMLQAMNTGHDGSLTTLHANSPYEVGARLTMMSRYAMDIPVPLIEQQIASALDLIVQLERSAEGRRCVTSLCTIQSTGRGLEVEVLAKREGSDGRLRWHTVPTWLTDPLNAQRIPGEEVAEWRSRIAF
jgi:pilus assembly protein CpaF